MAQQFIWGRNTSGTVGKLGKKKFWPVTTAKYWHRAQSDIHRLIDHALYQGHPWSPGIFGGGNGNRAKSNVTEAQTLALDIDDGMTVDEALAHPFIAQYAAAVYPSASHQKPKEINGEMVACDRFRIVFILPEVVRNTDVYEKCVRWLMAQVPAADPACKDASRFFFGSSGDRSQQPFLVQPDAVLPPSVVTDAEKAITIEAEEKRREDIAQELRRKENRKKRHNQRYQSSDGSRVDTIPLEVCIGLEARGDLTSGTPEGNRHNRGIALYLSLVGTREWLRDEGYKPDGDPQALFMDWAARSNICSKEADYFWRDLARRYPSPRSPLKDDAMVNCVNAYRWKSGDRSQDLKDAMDIRRSLERAWEKPAVQVKWKSNPYAIQLRRESPQQSGFLSCLTPGIGVPEVIRPEDFGDRVAALAGAGVNEILYRPDMGTGKTHQAGEEVTQLPPGFQGVYSGTQYRNAYTPTVDRLPILPVKHGWLIEETLVDGTIKQRHPRQGETPENTKGEGIRWIEPNCPKAEAYNAAYAAGLTISAGKDSPLCQTCDRAEITYGTDGEIVSLTCPFLQERAEVSQMPAYRCHPASIAAPKEGHHQINFLDEADLAIKPVAERRLTPNAVARELAQIKDFSRSKSGMLRHIREILQPIFDALQGLLATTAATEEYHNGIDAPELRKALLPAMNEAIATHNRIARNLGTADWMDAAEGLKWLANHCDRLTKIDINRQLVAAHNLDHQLHTLDAITGSRFTGDLLRALVNPCPQHVATISRRVITDPETKRTEVISELKISKRDRHMPSVLGNENRTNVYLDATATPRDLRKKTAGRPIWWLTLEKPDYSNLLIQGVGGTDGFFTNRTQDVQDRAAELVGAIASPLDKLGVIDYRRFHGSYENIEGVTCLARFAESRGCNRLENHNDLAIMGRPIQNLGQLAIEYTITTGRLVSPNDPDPQFRAWIERKTQAELIQECGRIRAHRSPNTKKTIGIAGAGAATLAALKEYFPTATVKAVDVMAIAPQAAAEKGKRTANRVVDKALGLAQTLVTTGAEKMPTVTEVANACETSVSTLKRAVKSVLPNGGVTAFINQAKRLLKAKYSGLARLDGESPELENLRQELDAIGCAHHFGAATAAETVEALEREFKRYGESLYLRAIGAVSTYGRAGIERAIAAVAVDEPTPATESPPPVPISTAIA